MNCRRLSSRGCPQSEWSMEGKKTDRRTNPREKASFLAYVSFIWTANLFIEDRKNSINAESLWRPYSKHSTKTVGDRLEKQWEKEVKACAEKNKSPSLAIAILKCFWPEFLGIAIIHLVNTMGDVLVRPLLLKKMLTYFTEEDSISQNEFCLTAGGMVIFTLVMKLLGVHFLFGALTLGMMVRSAVTSLVYKKSLRISARAHREFSTGHVINLISNDTNRLESFLVTANFIWSTPAIALIVGYSVYNEVGLAGIPGFAVILLVCFLQGIGAKLSAIFRARIAKKTDERIRVTDEVLAGIHVIKMHAWENKFYNLILRARKVELAEIFKANIVRGFSMGFNLFTRRAAVCFTIIAYVFLGKKLSATMVYLLVTYFGLISQVLSGVFVRAVGEIAESKVSINRLKNYLLSEETTEFSRKCDKEDASSAVVLSLKDVSASWVANSSDCTLTDINLEARKGEKIMVIGQVGSGKVGKKIDKQLTWATGFGVSPPPLLEEETSKRVTYTSLLQTVFGELKILKGTVFLHGTISYCSQEAWIFGGTIRENILMGNPYKHERYEEVIRVCSLERDLDLFIDGDYEMVGERGASLSGGQRARINLARAVYKEADIYLFDDPLSAVDTHVAKNIFENCFQDFLEKKTVIVATHQVQFLRNVDHIILLKNGYIEDQGSYDGLIEANHDCIKSSQHQTVIEGREYLKEKFEVKKWPSLQHIASVEDSISMVSVMSESVESEPVNRDSDYTYQGSAYVDYVKTSGSFILPILFFFFFTSAQVLANLADLFINIWLKDIETSSSGAVSGDSIDDNFYIVIYTVIVVALAITTFTRGFVFFTMAQRCSKNLHTALAKSVMFTDISFFNNNPTGAILNRFARDLGSTDETLPKVILETFQVLGQGIGTLTLLAMINHILMIPFGILAIVSYWLRTFFMKTTVNLKRLEGACRSPVFTHLSTTLAGLSTIRAYGCQETLINQFCSYQDLQTSALSAFQASLQSYTLLLDLLSIGYLCFLIFSFVIFGNESRGADVGLAITQTVSVAAMLQLGLRSASETTSLMTSVERVLAFVRLKPEEQEPELRKKIIPPPMWPTKGKIDFINVSLYYKEFSPVLRRLTFTINPGEKIGVVGRTGAGKSSITQALFRLAILEGDIIIDGINIMEIPLNVLRSRIAIIPQYPILFSGDIRKNLDPYSDYPDYVLLKVLDELEIPEFLKEHGLDTVIEGGGLNISIGQRQLICLARAILRNTSIIILDEATANVDPNTDSLIQKIIRKKFTRCTVLTIAHRLNTIMDSDRIMVMDAGRLVEFDHPHLLLQRKRGYFLDLVKETGREMEVDLTIQAQKNYWRKQKESLHN